MFNWFSLDFVYYPVSGIMWLWYKLFALILGPSNFFAWALSVMFLVFSLRALLYKPFVRQIRTTRQMQELQPQIKALQKKYSRTASGWRWRCRSCSANTASTRSSVACRCWRRSRCSRPVSRAALVQSDTGRIRPAAAVAGTEQVAGQLLLFSPTDVGHFLDANLFGAPIGAFMTQSRGLDAFTEFSRTAVVAVSVPLMLLAGIATYFNSRASVARQSRRPQPQTAMMNKLALYVFPLGVIVGGPFLPIAIIIYWVSNNIWTFGQQHYVFGKIEQEEEAKREEALARRSANAPAPGVKPTKRKPTPPAANGAAEPSTAPTPPGPLPTRTGTRHPTPGRRTDPHTAPGARPKSASVDRTGFRWKRKKTNMTEADIEVVDTEAPSGKGADLEDRLVAEGEIAGDYLEELLDLLDFDGDIDLDVEGDRAVVSIDGGEDLPLVGRRGEVLDALQELTRLAVHQKTGERSRLMLDIANWRRRRRDELTQLGDKVARRVAESGEARGVGADDALRAQDRP